MKTKRAGSPQHEVLGFLTWQEFMSQFQSGTLCAKKIPIREPLGSSVPLFETTGCAFVYVCLPELGWEV